MKTDYKTTIAEQLEVLRRELGLLITRAGELARAYDELHTEALGPALDQVHKLADEASANGSEDALFAINALIFSIGATNTLIKLVRPEAVVDFTRRLREALGDVAPGGSD